MKKTIALIVALMVSVCAFAQTKQHMKFMGIPMGISITSFQQKLVAKGLKYDKEISKYLPAGSRKFEGTFAGYDAEVFTYHDTKSNKVYRSKAVIERESLESAETIFYDISMMLLEKYPDGLFSDNSEMTIYKDISLSIDLGRINCFITKLDGDWTNSYKDRYYVHVDYWDIESNNQHNSNRMDDL